VQLTESTAAQIAKKLAAPQADNAPEALTTLEGLPKRIRQANLAPQLRRPAGALPDEPTVPIRSPEQVRSIMSALQLGTTRGRIDASRYRGEPPGTVIPKQRVPASSEDRPKAEESGNGGSPGGSSFADAATVSFPAIVNVALARETTEQRREDPEQRRETTEKLRENTAEERENDAAGDREQNHVTRPEKDA
jgi:hypothetical protein